MKKLILILTFIIIIYSSIFANDTSPMETYKPSYFTFGDNEDQVKVQLSFKYSLLQEYDSGLFLGYSQYMFWRLYETSSPFEEINYNPEVFLTTKYFFKDHIDYIKLGFYEHMSNGEGVGTSRAIDGSYIESQFSTGNKFNVGLNLKLFYYYHQENIEYNKYSKYYKAKIFLSHGKSLNEDSKIEIYTEFSGFNKGWIEAGFISQKIGKLNPRLFFQFRHGYLDRMIVWDEKDTTLRAGIIFK